MACCQFDKERKLERGKWTIEKILPERAAILG